jgi:hypothetical protein
MLIFCLDASITHKNCELSISFITLIKNYKLGVDDKLIDNALVLGKASAAFQASIAEVAAEFERTKKLAFCMGLHPNLGSGSVLHGLDEQMMRMILTSDVST